MYMYVSIIWLSLTGKHGVNGRKKTKKNEGERQADRHTDTQTDRLLDKLTQLKNDMAHVPCIVLRLIMCRFPM